MAKYAGYDSTKASPSQVTGWYDTDILHYPNLPESGNLLEVTPSQWVIHFNNPNGWAVSNGQLIEYPTPTE